MKVVNQKYDKNNCYFEISRISTVLNQWPLSSFLSGSVVAEYDSKQYLNEANKLNKQSAWSPKIKYAEIQRASNCPLLKPKIPKYREPSERNAKGISIAINFHLS